MRVWRFTEVGKRKDALEFDDTIALCDISEVVHRFKTREEYDDIFHDWSRYDYVCLWRGKMFPLYDTEISTKETIQAALLDREERDWVYAHY